MVTYHVLRALWIRAVAGDIVLCSSARHFTLKLPLFIPMYKRVSVNLLLGGGVSPAMD